MSDGLRSRRWSAEEERRLLELAESWRGQSGWRDRLAAELGRTRVACNKRLRVLGFKTARIPWTAADEARLLELADQWKDEPGFRQRIAEELGRTKASCDDRLDHLGWREKKGRWTAEEDARLLYLAKHQHGVVRRRGGGFYEMLGRDLGRAPNACYRRLRVLRYLGPRRRWTPAENKKLLWAADSWRHAPKLYERLGRKFQRTPVACRSHLRELGWQPRNGCIHLCQAAELIGVSPTRLWQLSHKGHFIPEIPVSGAASEKPIGTIGADTGYHPGKWRYFLTVDILWGWLESMESWHIWDVRNLKEATWREHFGELRRGWLTAKEVCERLGISAKHINRLRREGKLAGTCTRRMAWFRVEDVERFEREYLHKFGAGWLTAYQVAVRLGFTTAHVNHLRRAGKLPGICRGQGVLSMYRVEDIEEFEREYRACVGAN